MFTVTTVENQATKQTDVLTRTMYVHVCADGHNRNQSNIYSNKHKVV